MASARRITTSRYRGTSCRFRIEIGNDDHDHLIKPEERLRIAMARQ